MEKISQFDEVPTQSGQFEYKLKGFSGLNKKPGETVETRPFALAGAIWQLVLYPAGIEESKKDSFSFYLNCISDKPVRATISPTMVDVTKGPLQLWSHNQATMYDFVSGKSHGFSLSLAEIRSKYLIKDTLTISLVITTHGNLMQPPSITPKMLSQCIKHVYESRTADNALPFSDVVFRFPDNDMELKAHKFILACKSEVFDVMFRSEMQESNTGVVLVEDIEPAVMQDLLNYIYTDTVNPEAIKDRPLPLLQAAFQYGLTEVITQCEEELVRQITKENAVHMFLVGDSCSAEYLRQSASNLIACYPELIAQFSAEIKAERKAIKDSAAEVEADENGSTPDRKKKKRRHET